MISQKLHGANTFLRRNFGTEINLSHRNAVVADGFFRRNVESGQCLAKFGNDRIRQQVFQKVAAVNAALRIHDTLEISAQVGRIGLQTIIRAFLGVQRADKRDITGIFCMLRRRRLLKDAVPAGWIAGKWQMENAAGILGSNLFILGTVK